MNIPAIETRVREGLPTLVGPLTGPDQAEDAVRRAHVDVNRRRHTSMVWLAAVAVLVVLGGAGAAQLLRPPPAASPAASPPPITTWPTRGNQADNDRIVERAEQIWRSTAPAHQRPGRQVAALYAGEAIGSRATVVMMLSNTGETALVGIVSSAANLDRAAQPGLTLRLRSVVQVDPKAVIRSVGFVGPATPAGHPSPLASSVGYVLLAPGIAAGQVRSSMVDGNMGDSDHLPSAPTGLLQFVGFAGSGPWNSWVATPSGHRGVDVLGGVVAGPNYISGRVDSGGVVSTEDGATVHIGDLVVAKDNQPAGDGLLGVITSINGTTGRIDPSLTNLDRWDLEVMAVGSNYPGSLRRGVDGRLVFITDRHRTPNGVNRVAVRTADGSVAVNVGVFSPTSSGTPNTTPPFPLRQSDTLPDTGSVPVWVIATGE